MKNVTNIIIVKEDKDVDMNRLYNCIESMGQVLNTYREGDDVVQFALSNSWEVRGLLQDFNIINVNQSCDLKEKDVLYLTKEL
tara:strand:+ start:228 stop:476 length:249 start_codon:yes stop_codon:yes gene_type:complete